MKAPCSTGLKVLLVDDDPSILRLLSRWLEKAGYQVRQAGDGREAVAAIEAECPDFLLTDWEMPHVNGLELCRQVRQLDLPHYIYVIFLTVRSAPGEELKGLDMGADDYLAKPIDQAQLLARMRSGSRVLALERRLSRIAQTDPLTGLATRRTFYESLQKEWQRSKRHRVPLSCVMLDIDCFKRVNDSHGHPAGDAVLRAVAGCLSQSCRSSDLVCRYGGEEFCVMLPETLEHEAAIWAERVRKNLADLSVPVAGGAIRVTCSFGTAQRHDDTRNGEQLVDEADQALLCAKRTGRDKVVRFESLAESSELELAEGDRQGNLFRGVLARHVMTPAVACLREDETIGQAAEFFLRSRINSAPIVDGAGDLMGMLSEKDLMAALVSLECWNQPIRSVMKLNVICYEGDTPIRTIYEFLCRVSIRRIVVVEQGQPVGTISRGTLLRWFRNTLVANGLLDAEEAPHGAPATDPHRSHERLAETTRELLAQSTKLDTRLHEQADDLVPCVVGGVTRMQELLDDLLAFSRYANASQGAEAVLRSMLLETSPSD